MQALVIGGTQFMGREVVGRLLEHGHDVSVLHRGPGHDLGPGVRNLQADRGDLEVVRRLLEKEPFEAVFDFAYDWESGTTAAQVVALARMCDDALRHYVFISSGAAYGTGLDVREDDELAPDDHPDPYVRNKASTERALFRMHDENGFPLTTLRPPLVHGPRQPFYREQFFWDRLLDGRPIVLPDGGHTPTQWVFAADVAEACIRTIGNPAAIGQAFNVGHQEPLTQRTFVEALARTAGVEPTFVCVSREVIRAAGGHLFMEPLYFGQMLDIPPYTGVVEKATRLLELTPTRLDTALAEGFQWYLAQPRRPLDYAFEDRLIANA